MVAEEAVKPGRICRRQQPETDLPTLPMKARPPQVREPQAATAARLAPTTPPLPARGGAALPKKPPHVLATYNTSSGAAAVTLKKAAHAAA